MKKSLSVFLKTTQFENSKLTSVMSYENYINKKIYQGRKDNQKFSCNILIF